jgi:hypothetical protein
MFVQITPAYLKMNYHKHLVYSIITFMLLSACYFDNAEDIYQHFPKDCDVAELSFTQDIAPIINDNCLGCHGNSNPSAGLSLTSYTAVKTVIDNGKLRDRINRQPSDGSVMPPGGPMSSCNVDKINAWIEQGALEN